VIVDDVHPIRRPGSYPLTVDGTEPPAMTRLTVVGGGMLTRRVPDAAAALAPMTPRLARADITVGTLESTLSDDGQPQRLFEARRARRHSRPRGGCEGKGSAPNLTDHL
jgi:poly-gamma-glutamate synthesis protein (capsule biosynthesis protein)